MLITAAPIRDIFIPSEKNGISEYWLEFTGISEFWLEFTKKFRTWLSEGVLNIRGFNLVNHKYIDMFINCWLFLQVDFCIGHGLLWSMYTIDFLFSVKCLYNWKSDQCISAEFYALVHLQLATVVSIKGCRVHSKKPFTQSREKGRFLKKDSEDINYETTSASKEKKSEGITNLELNHNLTPDEQLGILEYLLQAIYQVSVFNFHTFFVLDWGFMP